MALADGIVERADTPRKRRFGRAERDFVALGVAIASIILFVGTGGSVMPKIVHSWMGFRITLFKLQMPGQILVVFQVQLLLKEKAGEKSKMHMKER